MNDCSYCGTLIARVETNEVLCDGCKTRFDQRNRAGLQRKPVTSGLQDYWKPTTYKNQVLRGLPPVPEAKIGRRGGCGCKKADARECFVDRKPALATVGGFERRVCDCECHSH